MSALLSKLVDWLLAKSNPAQLCVACTLLTALLWYVVANDYARAEVVERLERRLTDQWTTYLEEKLITLRGVQCTQPQRDKSYTRERISELSRRYFEATGHGFDLPDCGEL